MIKKLST